MSLVLHICNDFLSSKVHKNLYTQLDELGISQYIFVPTREHSDTTKNHIDFKDTASQIIFSSRLKNYHRVFFKKKISKLYFNLKQRIDIKSVDVVHATTWFSDGAIAYKIFKKYNIPYIITIRSTDTDFFFKYLHHLRNLGSKILKNAEKVIFLTPSSRAKVFSKISDKDYNLLFRKAILIPNGIDKIWLESHSSSKFYQEEQFKILYVGSFIKRKKVPLIIKSVLDLKSSGINCTLDIIGAGGKDSNKVKRLALGNPSIINYHGAVNEFTKIKDFYNRAHLFVMPSKNETFGLVYVEALSQGVPIIYVENEGVDGFFNDNVGEKIHDFTKKELKRKIYKIILNYSKYNFNVKEITVRFDWVKIAKQYFQIYNNTIDLHHQK